MPALKAIGDAKKIGEKNRFIFIVLCSILFFLSGCGSGGGGGNSAVDATPASGQAESGAPPSEGHSISPAAIHILPPDPAVSTGNKQTFKAEVTGLSEVVSWKVEEGMDGGSITADGTYTAPVIPGTYHVVATSQDDPNHAATAEITVVNAPVVSVAVEPAMITLSFGKTQRFNAIISGSADTAVTWTIQEGERGGVIQPDGTYTAPGVAGSYHLIVTSRADPTKSATATLQVTSQSVITPRFAYVANSLSNDVTMHTINPATGALNKIGAIPAGKKPYTLTVDPMGRFVYAGNFDSNTISMYSINRTTGALTSTGTVPTGIGPYSLVVDPSGRFAYAANENSSTDVWIYRIDQVTGVLSFVETVSAGTCPISMTIDPSGRFAYVANTCSNNISMYQVNSSSGHLTFVGSVPAGSATNSVAVDPTGKFAYVANYSSNDVWAYRVNPISGALTKIGEVAGGIQPFSITVDPSGRFAYVANSSSGDVWMYQINPVTGLLKVLGTVKAGAGPRSITAEPSGQFVYVANLNSNDISVYRINLSSGILTPVGNYPAGTQSRSVKVVTQLQ
jgi:6-phosphogluconolactonase (cycloisomerase 2 family)